MADNSTGLPQTAKERRSDRVAIGIPVRITGTDVSGKDFAQAAVTQRVARYGGSIITRLALGPNQEITVTRADGAEIKARVIGHISAAGNVYGIAFLDARVNFWGIHFPPFETDSVAKVLLACGGCGNREIVLLNELEFDVFQANDRLQRICANCREFTVWRLAAHDAAPKRALPPAQKKADGSAPPRPSEVTVLGDAFVQPPRPSRRQFARVRVKLKACVLYGEVEDVVSVLNVSRSGILVSSKRRYPVDGWIQVAMPYTDNAANIFVPGRIARHVKDGEWQQYGIRYLKR